MRALRRLLHLELLSVSRLAGDIAFAVGSAMGDALGYDCFLHVRPGGEFGRMASDFHSFANWRYQRCNAGQFRGVDGPSSDIFFSDLETAADERRRRLRAKVREAAVKKRRVRIASPSA